MNIIDKLIEAEMQPQKAIALGIAVSCGYERVTICEYCEMYYILRKWQKNSASARLKVWTIWSTGTTLVLKPITTLKLRKNMLNNASL